MLSIPQRYEDALWAAAAGQLGDEALASPGLRDAIVERSKRYTSDRDRIDDTLSGLDARRDLAARAVFFTPADAPKASVAIAELSRRGAVPAAGPVRVLDVGAGVGAMTLGIAAQLGEDRLRVTAIDRDSAAQRIFAAGAADLGIAVDCSTANVVGCDFGAAEHDVAIAGGVLNELPDDVAFGVVDNMLRAIDPNGSVVVVEPALRHTSRALHRIRDRAIASGAASVFAPCTRAIAPCPALEEDRDWCHEDRRVELTRKTMQLARATGLRDGGLKFSYLILRKQPLDQIDTPPGRRALRIVSQPRKTKGKLECFACSDAGRTRIRLLNRQRSEKNREFTKARRGDVVLVPDSVDARIEADTPVTRVSLSDR